MCFATSHQLSSPQVFTFHLSVVSGFQFPVKYLVLNLEIEIQVWIWTTVKQMKAVVLSYQYQCLLLVPLYSSLYHLSQSVLAIPIILWLCFSCFYMVLCPLVIRQKKSNCYKNIGGQPFRFLLSELLLQKKQRNDHIQIKIMNSN